MKRLLMSQNYELSTNEILTEALHRFGIKNQTDLAIEEMSELITAISHYHRGRIESNEVISEIADVYIMIQQLMLWFGKEAVEAEVYRKLARLSNYLDGNEYTR